MAAWAVSAMAVAAVLAWAAEMTVVSAAVWPAVAAAQPASARAFCNDSSSDSALRMLAEMVR